MVKYMSFSLYIGGAFGFSNNWSNCTFISFRFCKKIRVVL